MKLEFDFNQLEKKIDEEMSLGKVQDLMTEFGIEAEKHAKNTINTFTNHKGNKQGVASGSFRDSVTSDPLTDEIGFVLRDGVEYGIFHEYGTISHWLPFFDKSGKITGLGKWALKRFDLDGAFQVKGKRGKSLKSSSRKSREDVLRKMGGIKVQLDEMAPFRKALIYVLREAPNIFKRVRERG